MYILLHTYMHGHMHNCRNVAIQYVHIFIVQINIILSFSTRSIGCTVVEMLTRNPPLYDLEPVAAIYRIMTEPLSYDLPPHCSEHVHSFLKLCLIK